MAQAQRSEVFKAPIEKIFQVLTDYGRYPKVMDGVSEVKIISSTKSKSVVEFSINIIKSFRYTLELSSIHPTELIWTFHSGDLFKKNNGHWKLKDLGNGETQVDYFVDIDFKMLVPSMVTKNLVSGNLPSMMKSVEKAAQSL